MLFLLLYIVLIQASVTEVPAKKITVDSIKLNTKCGIKNPNVYFHSKVHGTRAETDTLDISLNLPSRVDVGNEYILEQELYYWKSEINGYPLPNLSIDVKIGNSQEDDPLLAHFEIAWEELPTDVVSYKQVKVFRGSSTDSNCALEDEVDTIILWLWAEEIDSNLIDENGNYVGLSEESSTSDSSVYIILTTSCFLVICAFCLPYYFCVRKKKKLSDISSYDGIMNFFSSNSVERATVPSSAATSSVSNARALYPPNHILPQPIAYPPHIYSTTPAAASTIPHSSFSTFIPVSPISRHASSVGGRSLVSLQSPHSYILPPQTHSIHSAASAPINYFSHHHHPAAVVAHQRPLSVISHPLPNRHPHHHPVIVYNPSTQIIYDNNHTQQRNLDSETSSDDSKTPSSRKASSDTILRTPRRNPSSVHSAPPLFMARLENSSPI